MIGADMRSGFPPIGTVLRWADPQDGRKVQATTETYRESGALRVYNLRGERGELLCGVMDLDPDTGVLTLVVSKPGGPAMSVTPTVRHA
ncbi:hypothetical protein [Thalassobaculum sp.]|uniref:hypothetical protein n=1 Tax=Thalassobaculum sp. TaxID=2022740 RepID=UPI0032EDA4E7